jgi:hypothetical protein
MEEEGSKETDEVMRWRLMMVADVAAKVGVISYMIQSGIVSIYLQRGASQQKA